MFHNHYTHFTESSVSENNHQKTILLYKHLQKYFLTTKNTHPKSDLHMAGTSYPNSLSLTASSSNSEVYLNLLQSKCSNMK